MSIFRNRNWKKKNLSATAVGDRCAPYSEPGRSSFRNDQDGGVAILFALSIGLLFAIVGGAVDMVRAYTASNRLQSSLDAATLAAASSYVNDPSHDVAAALDKGQRYFKSTIGDTGAITTSTTFDVETVTVKMAAKTTIATPFLTMVGFDKFEITAASEASTRANAFGNEGHVEISMMLDVTGSMSEGDGTGRTKLAAMKEAAGNLVDILVPESGKARARVALAPFSSSVNLGDDYIADATGLPLTKVVSGRTRHLSRCVTERVGTAQLTDAKPASGSYVTPATPSNSRSSDPYVADIETARECRPSQSILPLTDVRTDLKNAIDGLTAGGATAGALGTAWAWYLLSPEWHGVFKGQNTAKPYGDKKNKKIAILLTDGAYNTAEGRSYQEDSAKVAEIGETAVSLCSGMKAKGIEVYTIGFRLDNDRAKSVLQRCATDSSFAFLASDGDQLASVFREVAFRAVPLHLAR
ncbi:MAG: pilus assembly protein [Hyphomicrobiaceae bacterium]